MDTLQKRIQNAVSLENLLLDTEEANMFTLRNIIGDSLPMKNAIALAEQVAIRDSSVMITGETGTGKELFAKGIHGASKYRQGPFIPINCAAIPDSLLESILFGIESFFLQLKCLKKNSMNVYTPMTGLEM